MSYRRKELIMNIRQVIQKSIFFSGMLLVLLSCGSKSDGSKSEVNRGDENKVSVTIDKKTATQIEEKFTTSVGKSGSILLKDELIRSVLRKQYSKELITFIDKLLTDEKTAKL